MGSGARRAVRSALVVVLLAGAPAALVVWGRWPFDGGDAVVPGVATVLAWGIWGQFALGLVLPLADDPLRRLGRRLLADGAARDAGPAPVVRPDENLSHAELLVRVMGEVDAVRPHGNARVVPAGHKALEPLAYLAVSDRELSRRELERAFGPESAQAVLQLADDLHLILPDGVVSDYGIFCDLVARAGRADDPEPLLGEALCLVRGAPFSGLTNSYGWTGPHRDEMVIQVVDAAERLAELRLRRHDGAGAQAAARRGLLVAPDEPRMTRLIARAEEAL